MHLSLIRYIIENENDFQIERSDYMSRNETYNTKQKDIIIDIIKKQNHEFTVKDIYNEIKDKTGLTTIYRLVDKLVDSGSLNKFIGKDNITYYEYLEKCNNDNHFYLKCDNCGNMIHIDCDCIKDLREHIIEEHSFKLNNEKIIINGLCKKCSK